MKLKQNSRYFHRLEFVFQSNTILEKIKPCSLPRTSDIKFVFFLSVRLKLEKFHGVWKKNHFRTGK